jgi:hypothetical protein
VSNTHDTELGLLPSCPTFFEAERDIKSGENLSSHDPKNVELSYAASLANGLMLMSSFLNLKSSQKLQVAMRIDGSSQPSQVLSALVTNSAFTLVQLWTFGIPSMAPGTPSSYRVMHNPGKH